MRFWTGKRLAVLGNTAPHAARLKDTVLSLSGEADSALPLIAAELHVHVPAPPRSINYTRAWQMAFACLTTFVAAACLLWDGRRHPLAPTEASLLLVFAPLLLLARHASLSATRERSLTFLAPLIFGLTVWFGPLLAGCAAWVACWLYARFGSPSHCSQRGARSHARWQGAQFVCCAYASALFLSHAPGQWLARSAADLVPLAWQLFAQTAQGAAIFVTVLALSYGLMYFPSLRTAENTPAGRAHLSRLACVLTLGLLPIVLLAPLGAMYGAALGLPLLLFLLLSARLLRQQEEVNSLRKQLSASEAMGRASIHDPDVVDGAVLLQRFLALAQELVPAERSLVWILDQKSGELSPDIALPNKGPFARRMAMFGEGLIGHAAARMTPRLVEDASKDPHRMPREHHTGAWLLYPIVVHEQLLGVAQWTRPLSRPFTSEDIARLESLVPQAAVALENVYIRAQMHDLAATDGLTLLWNHKRMYELLREEIRRAARYQRTLSTLMLDVDSFKTFNDTYGHPQGDVLLKTVAGILQTCVRTVDHVGRYGGEEFMIILPETAKDDACRLAERIRAEIEAHAYVIIEGRAVRRTISVGVAAYPEDALSPDELVKRADEALYRAKRAGKNRVLWA